MSDAVWLAGGDIEPLSPGQDERAGADGEGCSCGRELGA